MKLFVVVVAVCFCFVLGRAGGQSALELGVKLFVVVVAVCFCFEAGGGPVSFRAVKGEGGPVSWV